MPGKILFTTAGPNIRPNGARMDVLREMAHKAGYLVETYSPGDGTTRYRFFDLAEMQRKGVSAQEQTYFGPLNGVHTALGLAAAKKFLSGGAKKAPAKKRTNASGATTISYNAEYDEYTVKKGRSAYHTDDYADAVATAKIMAAGGPVTDKTPKGRKAAKRRNGGYGPVVVANALIYLTDDTPGSTITIRGPVYKSKTARGEGYVVALPANRGGGDRVFPLAGRDVEVYALDANGEQISDDPVIQYAGMRKIRGNGRKAPAKRRNGAKSVADPVAAHELELYIENEPALVAASNSLGKLIMRNLARMILRGTYDSTKAWKAWVPLADEGAKRYTREYGDRFGTGFNKATREMVANSLAEAFESDVRLGAIDPEALVGVASNPRKRRAR